MVGCIFAVGVVLGWWVGRQRGYRSGLSRGNRELAYGVLEGIVRYMEGFGLGISGGYGVGKGLVYEELYGELGRLYRGYWDMGGSEVRRVVLRLGELAKVRQLSGYREFSSGLVRYLGLLEDLV